MKINNFNSRLESLICVILVLQSPSIGHSFNDKRKINNIRGNHSYEEQTTINKNVQNIERRKPQKNLKNLKYEEIRNLQFCRPLPNGFWDCSGDAEGYNDNVEDTWTTQPSPKPEPTSVPSSSPTTKPTNFPTANPTTLKPSQKPTTMPSPIPTKLPPPACKLTWDDNSNCRSSLSAKMTAQERRLYAGEYMCSPNKKYFFGMTTDFHVAICDGDIMVWEEGPFIDRNPHIVFKKDGELQVQNRKSKDADDWKVMWSSETIIPSQSILSLDDDGSIKITNTFGEIEWDARPVGTVAPTYSITPSLSPSVSAPPTISRSPIGSETYFPGQLFHDKNTGLQLSVGLTARLIAKTGSDVRYSNGMTSWTKFHDQPDAGGCFPAEDGGWYYLSNSEVGKDDATGGVGRIKFDSDGGVVDYKMVLTGTRMNCGSGVTPWNTYISCEEYRGVDGDVISKPGQCWEVHPEGIWNSRATKMGGEGGRFESVAFDDRDMSKLKGFVTTDALRGALHRFSPNPMILTSAMISKDYSNVLHFDGEIDYLVLNNETKTFRWSKSKEEGEESAELYYSNSEGIDVHDGILYFTAKKIKTLFILNLDTYEYTSSSTQSGAFNGQPDQIVRLLPDDADEDETGLLYFLEDGGKNPAGVFARDKTAEQYLTILIGGNDNSDESTGLAFCDNGKRMMVAFQDEGELYEIMREDGKPFHGKTVDIKYHAFEDEL